MSPLYPSDSVDPDGYPWAPTPEELARLVSAYAREHVGGYHRPADGDAQAGREQGDFTENTTPTRAQVLGFISAACEEVAGRAGVPTLRDSEHALARAAARWHAAAAVVAKRQSSSADEADLLYRAFISNYTATLTELIGQARRSPGLRIR